MASRATITRKSSSRTRSSKSGKRRNSPAKTAWLPSFTLLDKIPINARIVDRIVTVSTIGLVAVAGVALAWYSGLPGYVGTEVAQAVGRAGFVVKRVELTGLDRMDRLTVYNIALDQHSMAMPLVDLEKVRAQLLRYGWIEDARVSRRLPDTLVVDIVERKPAAVWQHNQKLSLIDAKGVVLERVSPDAVPDLPLLIGYSANREAVALNTLMASVPSLKPKLTAATWVGNRRWDLQFNSGEVLALPEGEQEAGTALTKFARIDGVERLLGRGFVRFDMRNPDKMVVRMSRTAKPDTAKPDDKASDTQTADTDKGERG